MAATDRVNYGIRPNKNVERKLVFEALAAADSEFPFSAYQYVGFGSFWFADFILAHRMLGMSSMISIEAGKERAARARFNAPFSCIVVEEGDAASVLPTLRFDGVPSVVWLDYEYTFDRVLDELGRLCARLASGSVLIVTVNASKDIVAPGEEGERQRQQEELFRRIAGDLAPAEFPAEFFNASRYPANVASVVLKHLTRATRIAGREERFCPLFSFSYRDGAPMVTVGGMIANAVDRTRLDRTGISVIGIDDLPTQIDVPPLTTREKLAFDKLLPRELPPTEEELAAVGFPLKRSQIEAYHRHYVRYPVFGEFLP